MHVNTECFIHAVPTPPDEDLMKLNVPLPPSPLKPQSSPNFSCSTPNLHNYIKVGGTQEAPGPRCLLHCEGRQKGDRHATASDRPDYHHIQIFREGKMAYRPVLFVLVARFNHILVHVDFSRRGGRFDQVLLRSGQNTHGIP